ncbi:unnamed protein product [Penicillium camemberti]|uniref:Str. FM013 n=1 Tax=Penicillium camemberti (strain FM 013) TaxID=1429867 RepID=A0A0G4PYD8_PENC3|nr:unnamed protein product [Penicillium camemberti]
MASCFLLFPPVLNSPLAQGTSKENASIGVAFALAACGYLPLFLLPFAALRSRISPLGNSVGGITDCLLYCCHLATLLPEGEKGARILHLDTPRPS